MLTFLGLVIIALVLHHHFSGAGQKPKSDKPWQSSLNKPSSVGEGRRFQNRDQEMLNLSKTSIYTRKCLLNKPEKGLYWELIGLLKGRYLIHPQASLGEVLVCAGDGHKAINSKRCDFLITDKNLYPLAVIEYHGSGHFQGNHAIRNEIKRNAVMRAGIKYIEIDDESRNELSTLLTANKLVAEDRAASAVV